VIATDKLRGGLRLALMVLCCLTAGPARAQLDTPAAAEARASLNAVEAEYRGYDAWSEWSALLLLPDVQYELRAGERGTPICCRRICTPGQGA
jgi:hypothetical protein